MVDFSILRVCLSPQQLPVIDEKADLWNSMSLSYTHRHLPHLQQVTLGMCLVGALPWSRGAFLSLSQILGGIASAGIVDVLFPGPLNVRTALLPGCSISQGLFIEMFLSAQLVFTIFMLAAEKHKGTFIAPVGIGLSLFIAELTGQCLSGLGIQWTMTDKNRRLLHRWFCQSSP